MIIGAGMHYAKIHFSFIRNLLRDCNLDLVRRNNFQSILLTQIDQQIPYFFHLRKGILALFFMLKFLHFVALGRQNYVKMVV